MAFLGRETEAEKQRIERMRSWIHARTPYALISPALAVVAGNESWLSSIYGVDNRYFEVGNWTLARISASRPSTN